MREVNLSILIPTRNRASLADVAIRSALAAAGPDDEIVVADNGDAPLVLDFDDTRLSVIRGDRVVSMPDNWERALSAARGKWVMLLADKFRVVPQVLRQLQSLIPQGVEVATYSRDGFYQSVAEQEIDADRLISSPGTLVRYSWGPPRVATRLAEPALREWYRRNTYLPHLPMLYTALVHRNVVARALRKSPRFFLGNAPDVASGLQILSTVDSYLETNLPAVLIQYPNDALNWSNGASQLIGGELARKFESEFGPSPFTQRHLPMGIATGIFETLLAFQESRQDPPRSQRVSWRALANTGAREIEFNRKRNRFRSHLELLRATQHGHPRPVAALEQLRMVVALRVYRSLARVARSLPEIVAKMKGTTISDIRTEEASLTAAISAIERAF